MLLALLSETLTILPEHLFSPLHLLLLWYLSAYCPVQIYTLSPPKDEFISGSKQEFSNKANPKKQIFFTNFIIDSRLSAPNYQSRHDAKKA